jgi:hypothetical protein
MVDTTNGSISYDALCLSYLSWPASSVCSGYGTCTSLGECQCVGSWHGRSEWMKRDTLDCNTNHDVIIALHVIGAIMAIFVCIAAVLLIRKRYRRHIRANPALMMMAGGQRNNISNDGAGGGHNSSSSGGISIKTSKRFILRIASTLYGDPPARLGIYIVIYCIFAIPFHLQRAFVHESEIVTSWPSVIFAAGCGIAFWHQATLFVWVLVQSSTTGMASHGAQRAAQQLSRMHTSLRIGRLFGWGSGLSQLGIRIGGANDDLDMQRSWAQSYLILGGLCGVYTLIAAVWFTYRVVAIIGTHMFLPFHSLIHTLGS